MYGGVAGHAKLKLNRNNVLFIIVHSIGLRLNNRSELYSFEQLAELQKTNDALSPIVCLRVVRLKHCQAEPPH
jgi:hypothetical protein